MSRAARPASHEEHFREAAPEVRRRLEQIQAEVERRVPSAVRCISYTMPAFRQDKVFFYFAAFGKHIGVYPPVQGPPGLVKKLAAYRGPNGNLKFPHADPLPIGLIGDVAAALVRQYDA